MNAITTIKNIIERKSRGQTDTLKAFFKLSDDARVYRKDSKSIQLHLMIYGIICYNSFHLEIHINSSDYGPSLKTKIAEKKRFYRIN